MENGKPSRIFSLKKMGKVVMILIALAALVVIGGVLTVVAYKVKPSLFSRWIPSNQKTEEAKKEVETLVAKVGKLIDLPTDESPTIATVSDAEKLKAQAFFIKSQNGDRVLFYTKAKKAILYRPSTNKIIDIAPLTVGQSNGESATGSAQVAPTPAPVKVSLLNGSSVTGLTASAEKKLKALGGIVVTNKDNAKSSTYTKTTIVNVKNVKADVISKIATTLGGSVDSLPAGEATPTDADILVILAP